MYYEKDDDLYNGGSAFKITARDARGVVVTVIADNYFGYYSHTNTHTHTHTQHTTQDKRTLHIGIARRRPRPSWATPRTCMDSRKRSTQAAASPTPALTSAKSSALRTSERSPRAATLHTSAAPTATSVPRIRSLPSKTHFPSSRTLSKYRSRATLSTRNTRISSTCPKPPSFL